MSNVIAFTPRPRPSEPNALAPLAGADIRAHLEEAAQTALDAADKIIAALDRMDGAPPGIEEPKLAADPEDQEEFRDQYARGYAPAREAVPLPAATGPEPEASPEALIEAEPEPEPNTPAPLPWHGAGNVVSAAGCAILALVAGA